MNYNYEDDAIGKLCLAEAKKCKSNLGFGAVLIKGDKILGIGRNRRAYKEDRGILSHVDYAIHAEQDAILQAVKAGLDVCGAEIYVLGIVLRGKNKGTLTTKTIKEFGCRKCPPTFIRFSIAVNIPMQTGWETLAPLEAKITGEDFHGKGTWNKFVMGQVSI